MPENPSQNTAVRLHKQGEDYDLKVEQLDIPEPGEGEVVVRLTLRPVNPSVVFCLQGVYPGFKPSKLPAIPGLDGVGVIAKIGPGVSKFKEGQRVVGAPFPPAEHGNGTWQTYLLTPEQGLHPVPDFVTEEQAAQFWINPVTVFGFFDVLKIPKGEYLMQSGASSAVGRQVIQLAAHFGIKTINIVRRASVKAELEALGADVVISSTDEDIAEVVEKVTGGKGAYAALDCVAGDLTGQVLNSVRNGGTLLSYGAMSSFKLTVDVPDLLFHNKVVGGFWLIKWFAAKPPEEQDKIVQQVLKLLGDGILSVHQGQRYSLEQVAEAVEESQKEARGGKVFLES